MIQCSKESIKNTSTSISDKSHYTAPINYLISTYIREYDISKANISILYTKGVINDETYNKLYNAPRMERQIYIGNMQKDNKISEILKNGIKDARDIFINSNNIELSDILSIKNDAIFVINKVATKTKFGNIEFVNKNIYSSFYKILKIELYYFYDMVRQIEDISIKGISDDKLELHKNYFLEFLLVIFNSAQTESIEETLSILNSFYEKYIKMDLDIGYYREFNSLSKFRLKPILITNNFMADFLKEENKYDIDISYNINFLRELSGIFMNVYNKRK